MKLVLRGAVQGVGFRPFVYRLAQELGLAGWVNNSSRGVLIEAEGPSSNLGTFLLQLDSEKPPRSFIQSLESSWLDPVGYSGFEIRETDSSGEKTALVLPDIATCPECLRDVFDATNRRHRYPFTNCTHCGPRFSIIEALPYDRANTSMQRFTMCPTCQAEYEDPANRRFHAQPNACPVCGPRLEFWQNSPDAPLVIKSRGGSRCDGCPTGDAALLAAGEEIRRGRIVAVKGIGGFHLMVDARNEAAVRRLRERKHREEKPFALMFPSLVAIQVQCEVSALEERLLQSPEAPIVLLRRLQSARCNPPSAIAPCVAPGNPYLGTMLPSNPLHHLLLAELGFAIVATSGNLSDEPICTDETEALERLGDIADAFLVHNRPIVRHVDDSIVRVMLGRELVLRRARGYAPLPFALRSAIRNPQSPMTLAVGAHLKSSVALSVGDQVFLSQHIGDLETEPANHAFHRVIADFEKMYEAVPEVVVSDLHPDYLSTRFAEEICRAEQGANGGGPSGQAGGLTSPRTTGSPTRRREDRPTRRHVRIQHHIAHVLSCMAENELEPPVLGVAWDGTGYGLDGAIWGGEFFLVTPDNVERVAHLRPFRLPGGEVAVKEPRRSALGLLHELHGAAWAAAEDIPALTAFQPTELRALVQMLEQGLNAPRTSSAGRLFDAVAALTGLRQLVRHEGQAAMDLEFAADGVKTDEAYGLSIASGLWPMGVSVDERAVPPLETGGVALRAARRRPTAPCRPVAGDTKRATRVIDWVPMVEAILADSRAGVPVGVISAKFHNALAESIVSVAVSMGEYRVALSGGCFQNRYLTERTVAGLREAGFHPYWHQRVPPNDGGIALGQVVAGRWDLKVVPSGSFPGCGRD